MSFEKRLSRAIRNCDIDKIEAIFGEIYREYGKLVAYIISKYVERKEDIEELTNDVFVNFSRVLHRIELDNIKYYLVVQAKNSAVNFLKKNSKQEPIEYVETVELSALDEDKTTFYEIIDEMRQVLSEEDINIILLHAVYEKTFAEIADMYKKSLNTVKSTYRRAIAKFRETR